MWLGYWLTYPPSSTLRAILPTGYCIRLAGYNEQVTWVLLPRKKAKKKKRKKKGFWSVVPFYGALHSTQPEIYVQQIGLTSR
jgi:hypothetical protein